MVKNDAYYKNLREKTIFDLCDDDSIVMPFLKSQGIKTKEIYFIVFPSFGFQYAMMLLEFAHRILKDERLVNAMREQFKYEISLIHRV